MQREGLARLRRIGNGTCVGYNRCSGNFGDDRLLICMLGRIDHTVDRFKKCRWLDQGDVMEIDGLDELIEADPSYAAYAKGMN